MNTVIGSNAQVESSTYVCAGVVINHDAVVKSYSQIDCNDIVASGFIVSVETRCQGVWFGKRTFEPEIVEYVA